jgi:NRAMP (natural resistance-associated macrophage protein)-like metal ion transporter
MTDSQASPDPERLLSDPKTRSGWRLLSIFGPGLITGASDDDPSGIATYSQAGAQFGYALTWTMLFTYPLMCAVQIISARLGRTTGRGIAGILRQNYPSWVLLSVVLPLLIANTVNIGADLGAMADATRIVFGGSQLAYVLAFALVSTLAQVFIEYDRYVAILKWLTLALLSYVATLFMVKVDWQDTLTRLLIPSFELDKDSLTMIVAVFGTTISPYLFFWQAGQEAEHVREVPARMVLKRAPEQAAVAFERIELDTIAGMGVSNIIGLAIMITIAATLHINNITDIETSAQAAEGLRPIAGSLAEIVFALGVVGTGLLAVPVLAGSAAYAIGEARKWPVGLARKPKEALAFYTTLAFATLIGMGLNFTSINPIKALYWTAVLNGVVAVPVMAMMMVISGDRKVMGSFTVAGVWRGLGWLATAVMAAAVIGMLAMSF